MRKKPMSNTIVLAVPIMEQETVLHLAATSVLEMRSLTEERTGSPTLALIFILWIQLFSFLCHLICAVTLGRWLECEVVAGLLPTCPTRKA